MSLNERQARFVSAAKAIPEYQGWAENEIADNVNSLFATNDQERISRLASSLKSIPEYNEWENKDVVSNIASLFPQQPKTTFWDNVKSTAGKVVDSVTGAVRDISNSIPPADSRAMPVIGAPIYAAYSPAYNSPEAIALRRGPEVLASHPIESLSAAGKTAYSSFVDPLSNAAKTAERILFQSGQSTPQYEPAMPAAIPLVEPGQPVPVPAPISTDAPPGLMKTGSIDHPVVDAVSKAIDWTREPLSPKEEEVLKDSGLTGELLLAASQLVGQLPYFMAAGAGGQLAAKATLSRFAPGVIEKAFPTVVKILGPKAVPYIQETLGTAYGFGGLGAVQEGTKAIAENKSPTEVLKDTFLGIAQGVGTAPLFTAGTTIGEALSKEIGSKVLRAGAKGIGGGGGFAAATAATGGDLKETVVSGLLGFGLGFTHGVMPKSEAAAEKYREKPSPRTRRQLDAAIADELRKKFSEVPTPPMPTPPDALNAKEPGLTSGSEVLNPPDKVTVLPPAEPVIENKADVPVVQTVRPSELKPPEAAIPETQKPVESPAPDVEAKGEMDDPPAAEVSLDTPKTAPAAEPAEVKDRSFPKTLEENNRPPGEDLTYDVKTNDQTVERANKIVEEKGVDGAEDWVLSENKPSAEHTATAISLISRLQADAESSRSTNPSESDGKIARAIRIASDISRKLTEMGQAVQAASIVSRLSPDGVVLYATKKIDAANKGNPEKKQKSLTTEEAENLVVLASKVQKLDFMKDDAIEVSDIINSKIKNTESSGKASAFTPDELKKISSFAKAIDDKIGPEQKAEPATRKSRQQPTKSLAKILGERLKEKEDEARKRFEARHKGIRLMAGLPLDDMLDLSIIGASKIARTGLNFTAWSSQMVADFGSTIEPHLRNIWKKSQEVFDVEKARSRKIHREARNIQSIIKKIESDPKVAESGIAEELGGMVDKIRSLTGDAKIEAAQELQQALAGLEKPTLLRQIATTQTISQLLNPKTILVRNPIGNELFYRTERFNKTFISTPIDWAHSKITRKDRTVTFRTGNQGGYWKAWLSGLRAGWKGWEPDGLSTQFDLRGSAFRGKYNPLTYMEKALGASLRSFDYAAYSRAKNQTIGEMAELAAMNRNVPAAERKNFVKNFINNADEFTVEMAQKYGKYATFQDESVLAKTFSEIKKTLNLHKEFGVGDLVLKYPKTPANLLSRAIDYSPAGAVRALALMVKPLFGKEFPATRDVVESISRAITGTGFSMLGYVLLKNGALSGTKDNDPDLRQFKQEQTGERNYTLNVTAVERFAKLAMSGRFREGVLGKQDGDTFVSYDWAQPVSLMLATGANAAKGISKNNMANQVENVYDAVSSGVGTLTEQPLMQGIQTLLGNSYSEDKLSGLKKVLEGVPASFVPSILSQISQATDNSSRETYDPNPFSRAINKAIIRLPFVRDRLPQAYKTLGIEKRENFQNASNNLFNVFLNPAFVSKYKLDPVIEMVLSPYEEEGRNRQFPRVADKKLQLSDKDLALIGIIDQKAKASIELSGEMRQDLQRIMANNTSVLLGRINPESQKKLTPYQQEELIARGVGVAAEKSRLEFIKKNKRYLAKQINKKSGTEQNP